MNLREALRVQSPSLALQRAATDEIARLDALVGALNRSLDHANKTLRQIDPITIESTRTA